MLGFTIFLHHSLSDCSLSISASLSHTVCPLSRSAVRGVENQRREGEERKKEEKRKEKGKRGEGCCMRATEAGNRNEREEEKERKKGGESETRAW
jgi:hypothetical protein